MVSLHVLAWEGTMPLFGVWFQQFVEEGALLAFTEDGGFTILSLLHLTLLVHNNNALIDVAHITSPAYASVFILNLVSSATPL